MAVITAGADLAERRVQVTDLRQAWIECYQSERDGLFNYLRGLAHDTATAEDLLHDVFVSVFTTRHDLPVSERKPLLYAAARNKAMSHFRRRRVRVGEFNGAEALLPHPVADTSVEERDESRRAWSLLGTLPSEQQEVIYLRLHGGLTFDDIATVAGKPTGTVASLYRRALGVLRERMEKST